MNTEAGAEEGQEPEIVEVIVPEGVAGERADKVLARFFPDLSRNQVQAQFKAGGVALEGARIGKNERVSTGQRLDFTLPEAPPPLAQPVALPLDILYEDEAIVALNKAPGRVTHPGAATQADTLVHGLLHHTGGNLAMAAGEARPGVVHRLDRETSGVIVFAKTDAAYHRLVKAFSRREPDKQYVALVGALPELDSGVIRAPIARHRVNRTRMCVAEWGREARTDWKVVERLPAHKAAFLRLKLHTGRTHQIRVHLADKGWPILGDAAYGYQARRHAPGVHAPRVMLHAARLELAHPLSGEPLVLEAPVPEDFQSCLQALRGGVAEA